MEGSDGSSILTKKQSMFSGLWYDVVGYPVVSLSSDVSSLRGSKLFARTSVEAVTPKTKGEADETIQDEAKDGTRTALSTSSPH